MADDPAAGQVGGLPRSRPERLIATGRVVLAASSLVAVWLDPSEPAHQAPFAYALLAAYLGYAVAVAAAALRWTGGRRWALLSHGFDLLFFSAFIYFTAGPASPFSPTSSSRWSAPPCAGAGAAPCGRRSPRSVPTG